MNCYACGSDDHLYRDCPERDTRPPAAVAHPDGRAGTRDDHLARIDGIAALWCEHKITVQQKRRAIADENLQWYGGPMTRGGVSLTTA
jgi:hypothetical protein